MTLKILVVDDTILFRRLLSEAITAVGNTEIIGSAFSGRTGIVKMKELKPDLVTLDIEMPGMDGLQVLDEMKKEGITCGVIVVSALTKRGGKLTISALEKGAFDFVTKPEGDSLDSSRQALISSLAPVINAFRKRLEIRSLLTTSQNFKSPAMPEVTTSLLVTAPRDLPAETSELSRISERMRKLEGTSQPKMILIGVSTGGPNALGELLPMLPADLGVPVFIVQHMPPFFTQPLAESLNSRCKLSVKEAENGETALPNQIYIAPGGRHLRLKALPNNQIMLETTEDPSEHSCRPAVDYLFRSAAQQFPGQSMAVILTGMGNDGMIGVRLLKRHGCFCIAQNEASCVVFGMPKAIVDASLADAVLSLSDIAGKILAVLRSGLA